MLRAAVIGCGWIGSQVDDDPLASGVQSHAGAYRRCVSTELVGVCDADAERVGQAARRWGLPRGYQEPRELLMQLRPDVVSVCTPDGTHAAMLREVLAAPGVRAVIAEKPLALTTKDARELVESARERGITLAVNYSRRYSASHVEARRRIAAGEIGTPLAVHGAYTKGVFHNASHWFDLARWLVGEIVRASAWPGAATIEETDPTCDVRLTFAGGQCGYLSGLDAKNFTVFEFDVIGTAGRLRLTESGLRQQWFDVFASPHHTGYRNLRETAATPGDFSDVALRLVENLVAALDGSAPVACGGSDALAALAVSEAAFASLRSGRPVEVEQVMELK